MLRDYNRKTLDARLVDAGFVKLDSIYYVEDYTEDINKPQGLLITIQKNCCVPTYKIGIIKGENYLGDMFRDLKYKHFPPDAWVLNAVKNNDFGEVPCMFYGYNTYAERGFRIPGRVFDISFVTKHATDSKKEDSVHLANMLSSCLLYVVNFLRCLRPDNP